MSLKYKMKTVFTFTLYGTVAVLFLYVLAVTMATLYPYIFVVVKQPMKILTPIVSPGETASYVVDYCKNTDLVPVVVRSLVGEDGEIYIVNSTVPPAILVKSGCGVRESSIRIPHDIVPQQYHISVKSTFTTFPNKEVVHTYISEEFTVADKETIK